MHFMCNAPKLTTGMYLTIVACPRLKESNQIGPPVLADCITLVTLAVTFFCRDSLARCHHVARENADPGGICTAWKFLPESGASACIATAFAPAIACPAISTGNAIFTGSVLSLLE